MSADRYELYVERRVDPDSDDGTSGLFARWRATFWAVMRAADDRDGRDDGPLDGAGFLVRAKAWLFKWVAQRVAEQRLLWALRRRNDATAVHPEDMAFDQVLALVLRILQRDRARHRRWLVIDVIGLVLTSVFLGPLFLLIPGVANLPAVYFGFRVVGHLLSMTGANHGLRGVTWTGRSCADLDRLRHLETLTAHDRDTRVRDIADRLGLPRLPHFFERAAAWHA